ncbi:MAG: hypothetical protein IT353_17965 [Gemmatimonadaceae bacterium]|nr:hypothetical protein [Gemmatimonadaceae bacterium]
MHASTESLTGATPGTLSARRVTDRKARWTAVPVTLLLSVLTMINLAGMSYYLAPSTARPRHEWHSFLRPSGAVGQTAGIVAFVIFVFLWLYPLRKKWRALAFTGPIGRWLDVHVTTALGLPMLLTIHAAWRADGVIGLGFVAMLVVCASGVVGRYLYVRIPRARSGVELTREDVARQRESLVGELAATLGEPVDAVRAAIMPPERPAVTSVLGVLERLLLDDVRRIQRVRQLTATWRAKPGMNRRSIARITKLASQEMALMDQSRMLESTQRVFRYWHIAHMPFALTALVAVTIHVVVVVALGTTWFW